MSLPEKNKTNSYSNIINVFLFLALVLIIACTGAVAYLNSRGVDIKNISLKDIFTNKLFESQTNYEISSGEFKYDANSHPEFESHKDFIVKCTKDSLKYLDKKGEELWSSQIYINKPLLKAAGEYLMVADIEGKDIIVFSGKDKKWEKKIDDNIISADISQNGYVTVIHEKDRCRSAVTVFNRQGMALFTMGKADNYIVSSKVSSSGKKVFINSIDTSGINTNSLLEITDLSGKSLAGKTPKEDVMYSAISFINDEAMFAVSDSGITVFGKDMEEKWSEPISGKIYSADIVESKYVVVAVSQNEGVGILETEKVHLLVYDIQGKKKADYKLEEEVKSIKSYEDIIAVNSGRRIYFFNINGQLVGTHNSKIEINNVHFISKQEAIAVGRESVEVIAIK